MSTSRPTYISELTQRRYHGKSPIPIRRADDVVDLLGPKLTKARREHFIALLLNTKHEVIAIETIAVGSLNEAIVHPREVFRPAIIASAAAVILVHNHPSGDPEPSNADILLTTRLRDAGQLLCIDVLDHIIIGSRGAVSFSHRNLIRP